jgi:hypothetical protein
MVWSAPPVGITQYQRFLSCDTVLLWVRFGSFGKGNAFFPQKGSLHSNKSPDLFALRGWGGWSAWEHTIMAHCCGEVLHYTLDALWSACVTTMPRKIHHWGVSHHFSNTVPVFLEYFLSSDESTSLGLLRFHPFIQCFSSSIVLGLEMETLLLR